ncbi:ATP-binding cassette domain-containing protein [Telmatocola sphagniphila]|uniref:ATP-binding cassette domain-containing protein n=1 Tax=Telmatocola sphagniphila TaxID=1123043 RepID=A0A8E6EUU3_9BACT|nr:ATP-binding cassette domain-containing protein [Telmatocola sphagniphila]QVL31732.1 ATP-binding cassette domain-containing protein [Telmatocola sphagniphila]
MSDAIEINNVTKSFGNFVAVNDLSLRVPRNTIYGFIGPNGSGKTTTLRMIMRIYAPDSGHLKVLGEEIFQAYSDKISYLPEERGLYKNMKVKELIRFFARLKNVRNCDADIESWLDRMGLLDWQNKRVDTLSKGMSQKVQFISAVIAKPELLILDEPFSGLDPTNRTVMQDAILSLRKAGTTVIFSTHDMSVAEKMCDFIFMIHKGRKVLDGTLQQIQDTYGLDTLKVQLEGESPNLYGLSGVEKITDFGNAQELRLARNTDTQAILGELMRRGRVRHFEITKPSLQDIFVRIATPESENASP